ncbi:putative Xaa-Pro aminopeptidase [Drechslerella stenobrocha 248]|uniref:Xaa-Pro aminopeptidase n=1 Tax=Drechslerella stenobrocha 248 TaxID=1043628 RepID=W7HN06_9PEZI|nr:putative Xaa-Pro aminopeptidase [Drechslerella stenobrocha 248]
MSPELYPTAVSEYISKNKYPAKAHARAVAKYLSLTTGLIYLESQKSRLEEDKDQEAPFHQRRYFFYLSGCALPNCYLTYDVAKDHLTLYIPPIDPEEVMWSGMPLDVVGATAKFDIDQAKYSDQLAADLVGEVLAIPEQVSAHIATSTAVTASGNLKEAIDECRVYKDDYEVALIKHANEISGIAHVALMKAVKSCKHEYELEALFLENCIKRGARRQAYESIIAAGKNAATLHYIHNNQPLEGKLNILIDGGCEFNTYASDITRVFPLSGKFTKESREIYSLVLKMQKESMAMIKPGVLWDTIHETTHKILIQGLLDLGIFRNGTVDEILANRTSCAFLPHGLGHHMGMDTHDTGGHPNYADPDPMYKYLRVRIPLKERAVITAEPGCYFCEFIIQPYLDDPKHSKYIDKEVLDRYWAVGGVRIEDDLLVTSDGYENLTNVIKELDEVENMVNS